MATKKIILISLNSGFSYLTMTTALTPWGSSTYNQSISCPNADQFIETLTITTQSNGSDTLWQYATAVCNDGTTTTMGDTTAGDGYTATVQPELNCTTGFDGLNTWSGNQTNGLLWRCNGLYDALQGTTSSYENTYSCPSGTVIKTINADVTSYVTGFQVICGPYVSPTQANGSPVPTTATAPGTNSDSSTMLIVGVVVIAVLGIGGYMYYRSKSHAA
jgi:hypothetical protein